ncbi:MAG: hydroxymethylbilane synthase [Thaumarchaeota archaeon]|nr:hydroxymethylbilane synthase [Nitrososphaerota archaeon]
MIVGTRGSKLSLIQTDSVINMLKKIRPELDFQKVVIKTTGDLHKNKSLYSFSTKGIFEREINLAVIKGQLDFAVHSLKDLPLQEYDELSLAAITKRESPNDVLISNDGKPFSRLGRGSIIGTSSIRRMIQVKFHRPDLNVVKLRGNVETRIDKVGKEFDAIILAEAGIRRLGLQNKISEDLPLDVFTPVPGQGAVAVLARNDNKKILRLLSKIDNNESRNECIAERAIASKLGGGCQAPIGVIAKQTGNSLLIYSVVYSIDGRKKIACSVKGKPSDLTSVVERVSHELSRAGISDIIDEWQKAKINW